MKSKSLLQPNGDQAIFLTGCFAWPLPQTLGSCHILCLQLLGILRDHAFKKKKTLKVSSFPEGQWKFNATV